MWWFPSRRRLLKLEKQQSRIAETLSQITQRLAGLSVPAGPDVSGLITSMLDSQGKQFTSAADFLRTINEIAVERAGAALGRRGGMKRAATAKRDKKGRMLPKETASDCPLCDDPLTANFSMADWSAHQNHRTRRVEKRVEAERDEDEPIRTPGPEVTGQPVYPLPVVHIPSGDAAGGAGSGASEVAAGDFDHGDHIHKADGTVVRKADLSERN